MCFSEKARFSTYLIQYSSIIIIDYVFNKHAQYERPNWSIITKCVFHAIRTIFSFNPPPPFLIKIRRYKTSSKREPISVVLCQNSHCSM